MAAKPLVLGLAGVQLADATFVLIADQWVKDDLNVAMGFHARARDAPVRYAPAVAMLWWSVLALRAFSRKKS